MKLERSVWWTEQLRRLIRKRVPVNVELDYNTTEDTLLVSLTLEGNDKAFASIYDRYWKRVFYLLARVVGDSAVAEELTQDTFVLAHRYLKSFDSSKASLSTWLGTIAKNEARRMPFRAFLEHSIGVDELSPERILEGQQQLGELQRHMETLPKPLRRALYMWAVEGLTYDEISAIMGCTAMSAKSYVWKARNILRSKYDER